MDLLRNYASSKRTICEVHREIYDILATIKEPQKRDKAVVLVEEAFGTAKKMNDKLFQYKKDWDAGMFKKSNNYKTKRARRGERDSK